MDVNVDVDSAVDAERRAGATVALGVSSMAACGATVLWRAGRSVSSVRVVFWRFALAGVVCDDIAALPSRSARTGRRRLSRRCCAGSAMGDDGRVDSQALTRVASQDMDAGARQAHVGQ